MRGRTNITFFQGMIRTPEGAAPDFKNRDFNLTVSTRKCVWVDLLNGDRSVPSLL